MATVSDKDLFSRIAKVVNSTYGTTGPGASHKSSEKVNLLIRDDENMEAKYIGTVTFTSEKNLDQLMRKFRNEAFSSIEGALKRVSKEYETANDGKSLTFEIKTDSATENVEYVHYNIYNTTRRAFFKLQCLIKVNEKDG